MTRLLSHWPVESHLQDAEEELLRQQVSAVEWHTGLGGRGGETSLCARWDADKTDQTTASGAVSYEDTAAASA